MLDEYNGLITGNEILQARCRGVGVLDAAEAVALGVTGPNLRACGIDYDLRRDDPYGIYDRFSFKVPVGQAGDCMDRLMLRVLEIQESANIVASDLPEGDFKAKVPRIS